ncbi:c-type cytochrome [Alkalicoccus saliphilus]|uniref:Cytochrome C551 n=1 Tax=Alkalicoccus saliphilus TaxID=200989 RepID=A0A2T4U7R2_9BACI|nr:cytochrome c [Alkalicoccus saliphilus]PTL39449.1 cytochrome C551 [Alkalicoccus saliphilus]
MKKIAAGLFGTALLLAACGGDGGNNEENPAGNNGADNGANNAANNEADNEAADENGEYDLANGEELYQGQCASCHGGDLEGGTGPALEGYSHDEVVSAIQEGPGSMPEDLVEGDDAEDVAAWVSDQN